MFLPKGTYGTSTARIKNYTDHTQPCKSCKSFDRKIEVYQNYYHFLFIPFLAIGGKTAKIRCNDCGEPVLTRSVLEEYENNTKTPFYLYSGIIGIALLIAVLTIAHFNAQKQKEKYAVHPQVGDVYTIKNPASQSYHFLRLYKIKGDSLFAYSNVYVYFNSIDRFEKDDFFTTSEEDTLTAKQVQQMIANDEIEKIDRNYDSSKGFNRIQ